MNYPRIPFLLAMGGALAVLAAPAVAQNPAPAPPAAGAAPEQKPPPSRLRWQNGETLPGELEGATVGSIRWRSPLFQEPVDLVWYYLRRMDRTVPPVVPEDTFTVSLRDGSQLHGNLTGITGDTVLLQSRRHGEVSLKRSEVLSLRRMKGNDLLWAGPVGDVGWKLEKQPASSGVTSNPPPALVWQLLPGAGGSLVLPYWNRLVSFTQELPPGLEADLKVRSSLRPEFQLAFRKLRVETWGSELVVAQGEQYKSLRMIDDSERTVELKLRWDEEVGKGEAFTASGESLGTWQFDRDTSGRDNKVLLKGKGRDLTLERLTFRQQTEAAPARMDPQQPRVELRGGVILTDPVQTASGGQLYLATTEVGPPRPVDLATVNTVIFSADQPAVAAPEMLLTYADGTQLRGRVDSVRGGQIFMNTSFCKEPFPSQLEALRQMLIDVRRPEGVPAEPGFATIDKLVIQGNSLHGRFMPSGDEAVRWQLIGAETACTPVKGATLEVTQATPAVLPQGPVKEPPSLFYTTAGDVLPGRLVALDSAGVELESSITAARRLPASSLSAVQFQAAAPADVSGFLDPGWQVLKGNDTSVKRKEKELDLAVGTAVAHWSAMQSSEVKFNIASSSYSTFRMTLFASGGEDKSCLRVIIANFGSQIYSGIEAEDNQLSDRNQLPGSNGKPSAVRLVVQDKHVEIFINGSRQHRFSVDGGRRAGAGLIIEPCSVWGNDVTPVKLTEFTTRAAPGSPTLPAVNLEARAEALTVPRFRKDRPPRHVLIAANGDVLRGEIEAATATHIGFRSGLETLRVPRDRVKAAVWLQKPGKDDDAAADRQPEIPELDRPTSRRVTYSNAGLSTLINVLKNDMSGVQFKLPEKSDGKSFRFQFGSQTVREALDQICALFGVRYRIESGKTVVIEAPPPFQPDMVFHGYWLKPGVIERKTSTQKLASDLGIGFPPGATILWNPAAGLLTMTNTAANHEKLKEVAAKSWGGILGSPTHWLLLSNGGRLGLAVQKFGPEFVEGTHPVYGACRVPRELVYLLRTQPPEESQAMKMLVDWKLVMAPEPVIPGTDAASDPSTGTEAKAFKLPLLGGGDFELAQQKGKVVVLDFWATWCGPCVKSLPGLIESVSAFPADKVQLIGLNQGEPAEQVKRFIETRNWNLKVALDSSQSVGRLYGVSGIPHTVVVGPDGKVALVKTGFSPENEKEIGETVKKLLAP